MINMRNIYIFRVILLMLFCIVGFTYAAEKKSISPRMNIATKQISSSAMAAKPDHQTVLSSTTRPNATHIVARPDIIIRDIEITPINISFNGHKVRIAVEVMNTVEGTNTGPLRLG